MKKVKYFVLTVSILTLMCGCVNVNSSSIENLAKNVLESKYKLYNTSTQGYKYYIPRGMKSVKKDDYNQVLKDDKYYYYLYADLIGYYNKKEIKYEKNDKYYFSYVLDKGIINIRENDNKYIVDIAYNYSFIEVECKFDDINDVVSKSLIILNSIKYNDDTIKLMISSGDKNNDIEIINIFDKKKDETEYLEYDDTYVGDEEADYDPDVIN